MPRGGPLSCGVHAQRKCAHLRLTKRTLQYVLHGLPTRRDSAAEGRAFGLAVQFPRQLKHLVELRRQWGYACGNAHKNPAKAEMVRRSTFVFCRVGSPTHTHAVAGGRGATPAKLVVMTGAAGALSRKSSCCEVSASIEIEAARVAVHSDGPNLRDRRRSPASDLGQSVRPTSGPRYVCTPARSVRWRGLLVI